MNHVKTHSVDFGDHHFTFEHGRFAHQAQGAVLINFGDLSILSTTGVSAGREGMNFFPLVVEFEPRFYAAGKLKHSKINKREGRKSDRDVLNCRVADRPLRPMFPKGMRSEVQVINTMLQTDGQYAPAPASITAASMSIQLAGLPFEQSVSAVHVGYDNDGKLILFPTYEQVDNNGLDLMLAGTKDAITMVEAGANLITDEAMIEALAFGHEAIKKLCEAQDEFLSQFDVEEAEVNIIGASESYEAAEAAFDNTISESDLSSVRGTTKKEVKKKMKVLQERLKETYAEAIENEELVESELMEILEKRFAKNMRKDVFSSGKRVDGRGVDEVRTITTETGVFKRLHGTGMFQRGETQVLSTLTLGGPDQELHVSDADRPEYQQRYFHHYNFPPYSVGETRPLRGPGRREIGHGALAERALKYVVPTQEDGFMYTCRVVSEVLACNGSSSMASVCGSTLALMDGGVPIKTPIGGIAMGLLMDESTGDYRILTDIQGLEDFDGDMDFKVTGDKDRITCLQLDIKIKGLKLELLAEALKKAQVARAFILDEMAKTISQPNTEMSSYAPLIDTVKIKEDQIGMIIGKGGETIQGMQKDFEVNISVEDDGTVTIAGLKEGIAGAKEMIEQMTHEPEVGDVFEDATVKTVLDFGAFVEFLPKQDALLHVSAFGLGRIEKASDHIEVGQKIKVKITEKDRQGRFKLEWIRD